jgi:hypothetical protein
MKKIIRKVELHDESKLTANNDIEKKFVFTGLIKDKFQASNASKQRFRIILGSCPKI